MIAQNAELQRASAAAEGHGSQLAHQKIQAKRPFVLVHGSWQGAWCFERISPLLGAAGHPVTARDLPGHGLNALFPASYSTHPRDGAFSQEPSPLAAITLADYTKQVAGIVNDLLAAGQPAPVLVGHSMGGVVIQAVAEALGPAKVHHLAYIAGFMPNSNTALMDYAQGPAFADSLLGSLLRADPALIGALRLDPGSASMEYRQQIQEAFFGDVDPATLGAVGNLVTPDEPIAPYLAPLQVSVAGWGAIARTYLRCANDRAIPAACQDLMISQADSFSPANKTRVVMLDSSHSPLFSQPEAVAEALLALA